MLANADDLAVILLLEELGRVKAYIAEALNDNAFGPEPGGEICLFYIFRMAEEFTKCVLQTAPRGLEPAGDAPIRERLAGDACGRVDVGRMHAFVFIDDPAHLARARSHIGCGHVLAGVDEVALDQLEGKAAGDLL